MTNHYLANNAVQSGVPAVALSNRQTQPPELELQRASKVVHNRTQRLSVIQEIGAVIVAVGGMASAIFDFGQSQVAICGFLWFLASAFGLGHFAQRFAEEAAVIQEVFDRRLFALPWNDTIHADSVTRDAVLNLAGSFKLDSDAEKTIQAGWYDPTDGLEYPYDVLVSQEQNLCWDVRLRRRFQRTLAGLGILWAVVGFIVALSGTSTAQTLLVIFVPAAAAYDLGRERWRVQRKVAEERGRCAKLVERALSQALPGHLSPRKRSELVQLASRVQDGIFRTRAEFGRVPPIIYNWSRAEDEAQFATIAEDHRRRLAPGVSVTPGNASEPSTSTL